MSQPIRNTERAFVRIGLADIRPISSVEHAICSQKIDQIEQMLSTRQAYVSRHKLDSSIDLPAANWTPHENNDIQNFMWVVHKVLSGSYQHINYLRLYCQAFTGYQLATLRLSPSIPNPTERDFHALDTILDEVDPEEDPVMRRFVNIAQKVPEWMLARTPLVMGEVGHLWKQRYLINYDTLAYQERLNLLYEFGIADHMLELIHQHGQLNILEIGGGYGALAYYVKQIFPEANYYICDLPESLLFSSLYLATAAPHFQHRIWDGEDLADVVTLNHGFTFLGNHMFNTLVKSDIRFDLVINTLSFSEMSAEQVHNYADGIKQLISNDGILFEQNQDNRHLGLLFAQELLADHFEHSLQATHGFIDFVATQGTARVWANRPITEILSPRHHVVSSVDSVGIIEKLGNHISRWLNPASQSEQDIPRLVEEGFHGFNIVIYRNSLYGISQSLGPIDINTLSRRKTREYQNRRLLFIDHSLLRIKEQIKTTVQ